jgi:hypothetical protein
MRANVRINGERLSKIDNPQLLYAANTALKERARVVERGCMVQWHVGDRVTMPLGSNRIVGKVVKKNRVTVTVEVGYLRYNVSPALLKAAE